MSWWLAPNCWSALSQRTVGVRCRSALLGCVVAARHWGALSQRIRRVEGRLLRRGVSPRLLPREGTSTNVACASVVRCASRVDGCQLCAPVVNARRSRAGCGCGAGVHLPLLLHRRRETETGATPTTHVRAWWPLCDHSAAQGIVWTLLSVERGSLHLLAGLKP